jgi:hypothetical protein
VSAVLARLLAAQTAGGRPLDVFPGYCQSTVPRLVQITGDTTLADLEYLGPPGSLAVGRVLLLRVPDGRPIILGNLNS